MTGGQANFACRGLVHHKQCSWCVTTAGVLGGRLCDSCGGCCCCTSAADAAVSTLKPTEPPPNARDRHNKQRLERVVQDITTPTAALPPAGGPAPAVTAFGAWGGNSNGSRDAAPSGGSSGATAGGGSSKNAGAFEPPDIEDLLKVGRTANVSRDLVSFGW
jgi:hypothetical protein